MAYGLHAIAHKNYTPDGSGRDWCFIGDFEYRNGRKTPVGQQAGKRPSRPPAQKRGAPAEVAFHERVLACSGAAKTAERWRRLQEAQGAGGSPQQQLAHGASRAVGAQHRVSEGERLAASSWQYGQHPAWQGSRYELPGAAELEGAGAIRATSAPAEPGPGDHTRGIRGAAPHFAAESWKLGAGAGFGGKGFELADGAELEGAGAIRRPRPEAEASPGDHTLGIRSRAPHFRADYHKLGQLPGWQAPEKGSSLKHGFHSVPCYPDIVRRSKSESSVAPAPASGGLAAGAVETDSGGTYQPGDHTLGIRAKREHFTSTYDDHGQIPGWRGKRFDFGPLANSRLRLTEWGRSKA